MEPKDRVSPNERAAIMMHYVATIGNAALVPNGNPRASLSNSVSISILSHLSPPHALHLVLQLSGLRGMRVNLWLIVNSSLKLIPGSLARARISVEEWANGSHAGRIPVA